MEYSKDFGLDLKYHPGKANKVADDLSQKEMHKAEIMILEYDLLEKFWNLNLKFAWTRNCVMVRNLNVTSDFRESIYQSQLLDEDLHAMSTQPGFIQTIKWVILFN